MIAKFIFFLLFSSALTLNVNRRYNKYADEDDNDMEDYSDEFEMGGEVDDDKNTDNDGYEEIDADQDRNGDDDKEKDNVRDDDDDGYEEIDADQDGNGDDDKEEDSVRDDDDDRYEEIDADKDRNDEDYDEDYESSNDDKNKDDNDDVNLDEDVEINNIKDGDDGTSEDLQADEGANLFCSKRKNGNYPDPLKCDGYVTCSNKIGYRQSCPAGLSFHHIKNQCNYPACHGSGFCDGKPDGNYRDKDTCEGYISCSNSGTYHMPCPVGLEYKVETDQCVQPEDSDCTKPADYQEEAKDIGLNTFCADKKSGNYADPKRCDAFIQCANGLGYKQVCPGGLTYKPSNDRCDFPLCKGTGFCASRESGNYPDPKKCGGFITCANGVTYHMPCPLHLHYNSTVDRCEQPDNGDCKNDCVVGGRRYKPGTSFIHPECQGSCFCAGPDHSCVSLCPPSIPNCGFNGEVVKKKVKVTNNPECYCERTVCKP